MRFRRVLCPVDFSRVSRRALREAAAMARASRGRLTVLFVNDPLLVAAAAAAGDTRGSAQTTCTALDRFVAQALPPSARPRHMHCVVAVGTPAHEILKCAKQSGSDLIVMGTRGMGRLARLLLGTTAETVLRKTRIPVLAVPTS